jgi:glycosyltransferase involved in cell wall biosynthesis
VRIAVLTNMAPFVRGGAELLAERLCQELATGGHEVELVRIPFDWSTPETVLASAATAACLRIDAADLVIAMKFPAYLVAHPRMVVWLVHPFRQVHDLWDTPQGWSSDDPDQAATREVILTMDCAALARSSQVFAISDIIADRLAATTGVRADVLMTPPNWTDTISPGPYGNYILALGRVGRAKRQLLAIEALAQTRSGVRLVIAGPPDAPDEGREIEQRVSELGLAERVDLHLEFISEDVKRSLLSGARGVIYLPIEEDSYGYVCLEAYQAHKPVITATDSGGTHILVQQGRTGLVVQPDPEALALAMDSLATSTRHAEALGVAGARLAAELPLSWTAVIGRLLS